MRFVILLHVGLRNVDIAIDFLADHALREELIFRLQFEIFERNSVELFLQPLMEFLGIGDLAVCLNLGDAAVHIGIDINAQLLALLDKQQLIDLITQCVRDPLVNRRLQRIAGNILLRQLGFDLLALFGQLAASNDFAVHLGNDFLNQMHLRIGAIGSGKRRA